MGYSYSQLIQMGATPGESTVSPYNQPKKSYSYDELVSLGAQPAPQPKVEKQPTLLGGMIRDITKPLATLGVSAGRVIESTGKLFSKRGREQLAKEDFYRPQSTKYWGDVKPLETPREALATGAQLASLVPLTGGAVGIGRATLGGLVKQGIKTGVREGAVGGGLFGMGQGLQEGGDITEVLKQTAGGAIGGALGGAVFGTTLPVIGAGLKRILPGGEQIKIQNIISKREKALEKIEGGYSAMRKAAGFSKDAGKASRQRVASTDVLVDAVDENGLIRTKQPGGAVEQYKMITLDGAEKVVRNNLERLGEVVNLTDVEKGLTDAVYKSGLQGKNLITALRDIKNELAGYRLSADAEGNVPLTLIHDAKIDTTNSINYLTPPEIKSGRKAIARGLKKLVENNSSFNVRPVNKELEKYLGDIEFLERLDGKRVKGGKLGKYFAQISGHVIGTAAGGAIGGFPGAAVGSVIGGEVAGKLKGSMMSRALGGKTGIWTPKNKIIQEAIDLSKTPYNQRSLIGTQKSQYIATPNNPPNNIPISTNIMENAKNGKRMIVNSRMPSSVKKNITSVNNLSPELTQKGEELAIRGEMIKENSLNSLWVHANKREGVLPEVTGKGKSIFSRKGDDIVTSEEFDRFRDNSGQIDNEKIREEFVKFVAEKRQYRQDLKEYKQQVRDFAISQKDNDMLNEIAQRDDDFMIQLLSNAKNQSAYGAVAGIKQDEEGNIKFDPKLAALGVLGLGTIKSKTGTQLGEQIFKGFKDLTTKFLDYAKGKTTLSRQEITDFARRPELKKGEADLLNKLSKDLPEGKLSAQEFADSMRRDLLELKPVKVKEPQFQSITVEGSLGREGLLKGKKIRGENYEEVVFESPIQTNGSSHFPNSKNYFAHARGDEVVEGGKKIWREQEIQSDLLQKDNLQAAKSPSGTIHTKRPTEASILEDSRIMRERGYDEERIARTMELDRQAMKAFDDRAKELAPLDPFTNDRFGERIMRERIKDKASKGYEKYRLPTGETIGKIEGFEIGNWATLPEGGGFGARLKPENLKVGMRVQHNNDTEWIVTDVLGEGRFKVIPQDVVNGMEEQLVKFGSSPDDAIEALVRGDKEAKRVFNEAIENETFDLTGKSNPQYRRYENWGKFLKNKYGGKEVTDPQGNKWIEIDLKKEYGKIPVEAFGIAPLILSPLELRHRQEKRQLQIR